MSPIERTQPACAADEPGVVACVKAAYLPYLDEMDRPPAPMLDDYGELIGRGVVWVAEHDDRLVGVIVMWANDDHWHVDNIAVDPAHHGTGIGTRLLRQADRCASAAGLSEVRLYTNEAMTGNTAFYPRRGFVETGRSVDAGYRRIFYSRAVSGAAEA